MHQYLLASPHISHQEWKKMQKKKKVEQSWRCGNEDRHPASKSDERACLVWSCVRLHRHSCGRAHVCRFCGRTTSSVHLWMSEMEKSEREREKETEGGSVSQCCLLARLLLRESPSAREAAITEETVTCGPQRPTCTPQHKPNHLPRSWALPRPHFDKHFKRTEKVLGGAHRSPNKCWALEKCQIDARKM